METAQGEDTIRVYWQPGCTSCLRTKEFLTKNKVAFQSRNILQDEGALDELAAFGLKQVPIVTRKGEWVDGQVLGDVARIAGIPWGGAKILPVPELRSRLNAILDGTQRFLAQLPDPEMDTMQPNRPRSYRNLVFHIFNIPDAFLEHERGIPLENAAYDRVTGPDMQSKASLSAYGQKVRDELDAWFEGEGARRNWSEPAKVYYGKQTMHEFLERTTWHSGQHTRQLMWALERLGITPERPLGPETFKDLPMPEQVWEDDPQPQAAA